MPTVENRAGLGLRQRGMTTTIAPPEDPRLRSITPAQPTGPPPPSSLDRAAGPGRSRRWRWFSAVAALVIVVLSLAVETESVFVLPLLFVLIVPFEKLFPRHRQKLRRHHVVHDMGYALSGPVLNFIGVLAAIPIAIITLGWVPGLAIRPLIALIPGSVMPFVGLALFDLAIYWTHRWYHEVPFLWRFHSIHHSTEHLDWVSGFRNHPLDGTLIAPAFMFLLAAGFSSEFTGALAVVQIVLGLFLHANVRWRLKWLHKIVITPEFHHWHHANEPGAINSNYSVFLPAWDLLFGTYFMPKDRRPQRYGVNEYIPDGMVAQLHHPLRGAGNPLTAIRHPFRSTRAGCRFVRRTLLPDLCRSTRRPRRPSHSEGLDEAALWAQMRSAWPR